MKKILTFLFACAIISSCQNQDFDTLQDGNTQSELEKVDINSLINYKGLKVRHRFEPMKTENPSSKAKSKKTSVDRAYQNLDTYFMHENRVLLIVDLIIGDFPYSPDGDFSQADLNMIQNDFPLLSNEEIVVQMDIIDDYYGVNFYNAYIQKYDEVFPPRTGGPIDIDPGDDPGDGGPGDGGPQDELFQRNNTPYSFSEIKCALQAAGYYNLSTIGGLVKTAKAFYALYRGTPYAIDYSTSHFPDLDSTDTKRDAYRHMMWNAMLANYYFALSSKSKRLNFAKSYTDAWENAGCGNANTDAQKSMDLHNNELGRYIWNINTHYVNIFGITVGLDRPTHSVMKTQIGALADWSKYIDVDALGVPATVTEIEATPMLKAVHIQIPDAVVTDPIIVFRPNTPEYRININGYTTDGRPSAFVVQSDYNLGIQIGDRMDIDFFFECLANDGYDCNGPCGLTVVGDIFFDGKGTITQSLGSNRFLLVPDNAGWEVAGTVDMGCDSSELIYSATYTR